MLIGAVLTVGLLLALLTLISTLIGRRMPQILDALEAGASEAVRQQALLRYAA